MPLLAVVDPMQVGSHITCMPYNLYGILPYMILLMLPDMTNAYFLA